MVSGLRVEDRLDGATNFCPWRARIVLLLQENELWDIVENTPTYKVTVPDLAVDMVAYTAFSKKDIKAKEKLEPLRCGTH